MSHFEEDNSPRVVKDAKGKRPQFYQDRGLDHAMSMIMTLANELSVLRDRMDAHERISKAKGIDIAAEIDAFVLDEEALNERELKRQQFLDRLFYLSRKEVNEAKAQESTEQFNETIEDIAKG